MRVHNDSGVRGARKWTKASIVGAVAAMVLTACAGGGTAAPEEGSTGGSGQPQELGKIRVIQSIAHDLTMGGVEVAQQLGLYPDGLEVEIITGTQVAQALATGDVDLGVSAPTRVTGAILEGLEATIVAPTIDVWDQYVIASTELGAKSIEDMEGVTWGTSTFGSASDYSIRKIADTLGWDEPEIVTMGDINGLIAGLQNGTIDAFMWGSFAPFEMEAEGYATVVGSATEVIGPAPLDVIAVTNEFLEKNPAAVKAFCQGVHAANKAMQDDPDMTQKIFEEWGIAPQVVTNAMEAGLPLLSTNSEITDEQLENIVDATKFTVEGADDFDLEQMKGMYKNCDEL